MFKKHYLLGSIALFFLSGCTGLPLSPNDYPISKDIPKGTEAYKDKIKQHKKEIENHVIAIGKYGELRDPITGQERSDSEYYLKNIVNQIQEYAKDTTDAEPELLIYIHGGLNNEAAALKRAMQTYRLIRASGKYPLFINWNSEGLRSYGSHLAHIRQGEQSDTAWATSPIYFLSDIGNSLVNAPKAWTVTGIHWFDSLKSKKNADQELCAQQARHNKLYNHPERELVHSRESEIDFNLSRKLQWLITIPSKIITTPFTYTLAKPAWDIMLRRTSTLFYTCEDLKKNPSDNEECEAERSVITWSMQPIKLKNGNGSLYRFLSALETDQKKTEASKKVKITLIGHSMGAIIVNQIVNLGLDLIYKNIVHMASADSIENLLNKVVPYIDCSLEGTCNMGGEKNEGKEKNKGKKDENNPVNFYSLHLHPDNENRETSGGGFIPSGSLLTWIDNMYTVPKTVLDKRSGRWDNMTRAIELIPPVPGDEPNRNNIKGQMHFTIFGIQERKPYDTKTFMNSDSNLDEFPEECEKDKDCLYPTAQKHGDFGDLPFWREEVWKGEHLSSQGKSK
ncbi:MAG: hypothetical protein QTN59_15180 [Candidatus Electrothrix communis]|nr:MAG: hypothetical protein QTN59_15180 [Candidatus Electrothrix communis]